VDVNFGGNVRNAEGIQKEPLILGYQKWELFESVKETTHKETMASELKVSDFQRGEI
jgi:hypothetical protein